MPMPERPIMYLDHEDWSPRYQDTFYTVRLDHFELFASFPNTTTTTTAADDDDDHASFPNTPGNPGTADDLQPQRTPPPPGKTNFPAYYYKVEVFCGRHEPKVIFRRYSQFKWLYENLPRAVTAGSINDDDGPLSFPPGTVSGGCLLSLFDYCRPQNDEFARKRAEQLREFLREALTRRGVASHMAVAQFLELDGFAAATS